MIDEDISDFGADAPPDNLIPFPRMRPSQRVRDAWAAAVAKTNQTKSRRYVLPSPLDALPSLLNKRAMPAMPWPEQWQDLGLRCRTYVGQCIGITAAIGAGKTSFAAQIAIAVSGHGHPVLWDPVELDPDEMDLRALANMHGTNISTVRDHWTEEQIRHGLVAIDDLWHYVDQHDSVDEHLVATEDALRLAWEVYRVPPVLVVDHLGELVAEERDDRAALRRLSSQYRKLAARTNSWIILLNQVSKGNQGATTGKVDFESATDAMAIEMGSQAIASGVYTSIVLNVFKMDDAPILDAHALIPKARNTGREGRVGMRFHKPGGQWFELDYLPATPNQAKAAEESDKKDKHRSAPPRTPAQARADINAAKSGDAAAMRRAKMLEAVTRHGMLGIELHDLKRVLGVGRGALFQQALQELERAESLEKIGTRVRMIARMQ